MPGGPAYRRLAGTTHFGKELPLAGTTHFGRRPVPLTLAENEIQAERDGVVKKIAVKEGQAVDGGDVLFEIG